MVIDTSFTAKYPETDQMGIVHHSNYPVWFEAGRTEFLKKIGISILKTSWNTYCYRNNIYRFI